MSIGAQDAHLWAAKSHAIHVSETHCNFSVCLRQLVGTLSHQLRNHSQMHQQKMDFFVTE